MNKERLIGEKANIARLTGLFLGGSLSDKEFERLLRNSSAAALRLAFVTILDQMRHISKPEASESAGGPERVR